MNGKEWAKLKNQRPDLFNDIHTAGDRFFRRGPMRKLSKAKVIAVLTAYQLGGGSRLTVQDFFTLLENLSIMKRRPWLENGPNPL